MLFAGLFDMMDGRVARVGKMSSTFGALYDSVLDRYSELVTLFGIFYYLMLQGYLWGLHHYIHCADRFADGELRACPCRRFGAGV